MSVQLKADWIKPYQKSNYSYKIISPLYKKQESKWGFKEQTYMCMPICKGNLMNSKLV